LEVEMSAGGEKNASRVDDKPGRDRLDSWKEIAAYLGRDVRTAQRWEKEECLPIHRHPHKKLGTVYAFREELDDWSNRRQVKPEIPAVESRPKRWRTVSAVVLAVVLSAAIAFWPSARQPAAAPHLTFRQITTDDGLTWQPAVSLKGDLVAYASDRATGENLDIWVQQTARGAAVRLTDHEADDSEPAFSPDGATIAFRSERDGGGIYVVPALGGETRRLVPGGRRPRFSPDGKWIAYWVGRRPDRFGSLYVIPAAGGEPRRLTDETLNMRSPVWAPDSRHLLMVAWRSSSPRLGIDWYVVDSRDGSLVRTGAAQALHSAGLPLRRRSPALVDADAWIPETSDVIFSGESGDTTNLWKITIQPDTWKVAGLPVRLTSGTGLELHGSASSSGLLVFSSVTQNADIWSLPLDPNHPGTAGEITRLTRDAAADLSPSISADGKRLVFESVRTGKRLVWKKDLAAGEEVELVTTPSDEALPKITADGQLVAYLAFKVPFEAPSYEKLPTPPKPDIFTVPFTGGHPRKACAECGLPLSWSADSATLLYLDGPAISALDLVSGNRHKILDEPEHRIWGGRFSPDGQWIVFWGGVGEARQPASFVAPFRGPRQRISRTDWMPLESAGDWSPDGRVLYSPSRLDGSHCLWAQRVNPESKHIVGEPVLVYHFHRSRLSFHENPEWRGLSVARDKIVFTLNELRGNIWTASLADRAK
jgi:Tol biopolymer transport system component